MLLYVVVVGGVRGKRQIFIELNLGSRQIFQPLVREPELKVYGRKPARHFCQGFLIHSERIIETALIEVKLPGVIPGYCARRCLNRTQKILLSALKHLALCVEHSEIEINTRQLMTGHRVFGNRGYCSL